MKTLLISLLLLSSLTHADFEAEFKVTNLTYNWGGAASFPLTLYQAGHSYKSDYGTGASIFAGLSNTERSTVNNELSAGIKNFFSFSLNQSVSIANKISVQGRLIYTEYKSCSNKYGCNPDTSTGYGVSGQYDLGEYGIKLSYDNYYEKQKTADIREHTNGVSISLVARF